MAIIVDTSCLITLNNLGELNLLHQIFNEITITPQIKKEFGESLPEWIKVIPPQNIEYVDFISTMLDKGEASAIALSQEIQYPFLIIDELKGRNVAFKFNLEFTGTLGILIKAKENGLISSVKEKIGQLKQNGFRISMQVEKRILSKAKEN